MILLMYTGPPEVSHDHKRQVAYFWVRHFPACTCQVRLGMKEGIDRDDQHCLLPTTCHETEELRLITLRKMTGNPSPLLMK